MSVVVFGSINRDLVMRVPRLPLAGETVAATSYDLLPGGKGANQAVAAARMGVPTVLLGAVGEDAHGTAMLAALAEAGVGTGGIARLPGPTGLAHVFVSDDGENQIVVVAGANGVVEAPAQIPAGTQLALAQAEVPAAAVTRFLTRAREAGARTLYNAAPALPAGRAILPLADIIVVNETELAFFLDLPGVPADDAAIAAAARALAVHDGQWVIVTLGGAGVLAQGPGGTLRCPAPRVPVVDTTGAGDTFCGVLGALLAEGATMAEALDMAIAAAAISVQRIGAAASMPTRAEVEGVR